MYGTLLDDVQPTGEGDKVVTGQDEYLDSGRGVWDGTRSRSAIRSVGLQQLRST